ncbi:MAG TPA: hypothetical protein VFL81_02850 [Candidatus Saccharimonadales bacterium]|nr:hypothetical protein [Candidatus Saccharimonadales bacterium]
MNLNNRYLQLSILTVGLAVVIYLLIWLVFSLIGLSDFPKGLQLAVAVLGAGLLVYKFFADRIF